MPKIFSEETISLVWDMITKEKMLLRDVAKELCTDTQTVNQIYMAGYRRYGCNQHSARKNADKLVKLNGEKKQINRPPARYSNQGWWEFLSK